MKISLDDGKTWIEVEGVRIIQEFDPMVDKETEEEINAELQFNFTKEGMIMDVLVNNVCDGTSSEMYHEIGDRLVNY